MRDISKGEQLSFKKGESHEEGQKWVVKYTWATRSFAFNIF